MNGSHKCIVVVDSVVCEICGSEDESPEHIIQGCAVSVSFWAAIVIQLPPDRPISELHTTIRPVHFPTEQVGMATLKAPQRGDLQRDCLAQMLLS